jgi:hypothetical protein
MNRQHQFKKMLRHLLALVAVIAFGLIGGKTAAQELQPVESAPAFGTFWLVQQPVPYPFDPFFGQLPIYDIGGGIYLLDDSQLDYSGMESGGLLSGGGGMMTMSSESPPSFNGGTNYTGGTNLPCSGPTNFTVAYQFSTNGLRLDISLATNNVASIVIHAADTNAYDVFGTTNLASLALSALSQTNWVWLVRASGTATNFSWTNITPCEAWFQAGTMTDGDADGLTTAYETLVSHTLPGNSDSDADGILDGVEVQYALNPNEADPPFTISITQPAVDSL